MTGPAQRSLTQVLEIELEAVKNGAEACGASHHGEPAPACMRTLGHEETGELSRESHATLVTDGGRYWLTWVNLAPEGQ